MEFTHTMGLPGCLEWAQPVADSGVASPGASWPACRTGRRPKDHRSVVRRFSRSRLGLGRWGRCGHLQWIPIPCGVGPCECQFGRRIRGGSSHSILSDHRKWCSWNSDRLCMECRLQKFASLVLSLREKCEAKMGLWRPECPRCRSRLDIRKLKYGMSFPCPSCKTPLHIRGFYFWLPALG